ncbi:MAG: ATP-binding protein, partial [Campylobacterales bacterium]|nr:ATP-binding protein [Campylobacterales bacterium]
IKKQSHHLYKEELNKIDSQLRYIGGYISQDLEILDAIVKKDRKKLLEKTKPIFTYVQNEVLHVNLMHFHNTDHTSLLRLHKIEKFGDNLEGVRPIISQVLKTKKIFSGVESGLFDQNAVTYRIAIPLFKEKDFIGIVEFGIDVKNLLDYENHFFHKIYAVEPITAVLLHKDTFNNKKIYGQYKDFFLVENIPIFQTFLKNPTEKHQKLSADKEYLVDFNGYKIKDFQNNIIGNIVLAYDVTKYYKEIQDKLIHSIWKLIGIMTILILILEFSLTKFIDVISSSKKRIQKILDSQNNLVILTNGDQMIEINRSALKFFGIDSFGEFNKKFDCICDSFIEEDGYLKKDMDGIIWDRYVYQNPHGINKAKIKNKYGEIRTFRVESNIYTIDNENEHVAVLTDITDLEDIHNNLERKVQDVLKKEREQEEVLRQQSKLASMGEMIGNIAHQWRQPLNAISLQATSLATTSSLGKINEEKIEKSTDKILTLVEHLSQTIDDFRNFFKENKEKKLFTPEIPIEKIKTIIDGQLKSNNIKLLINNQSKEKIYGLIGELEQVILNIINNGKDAIVSQQKNNKEKKFTININIYDNRDNCIAIEIIDNGGGIPEDILHKVFEPYFTTKFKSQGTGIGLYMSKTIIEKNMNGRLNVENIEDGAKFTILLPSRKEENIEK